MDKPKVFNKHGKEKIPRGSIYIGRGSSWGNPFSHLPNSKSKYTVKTRLESIESFKKWFEESIESEAVYMRNNIWRLRGQNLVCFCKPFACHGDYLLRRANPETT